MSGAHVPVLMDEVVAHLTPAAGQMIVDGTFGAGGYSRAILAFGATVVAFDRDPRVAVHAQGLPVDRFRLVEARFSEMAAELGEATVDGVALDLGVSSM
jgi:16S rRNA (cytosine1402-N4)-methyltransferase